MATAEATALAKKTAAKAELEELLGTIVDGGAINGIADDGVEDALSALITQKNMATELVRQNPDLSRITQLDGGIKHLDDAITNLTAVQENLGVAKSIEDLAEQKVLLNKTQRLFDQAAENTKLAAGTFDDAAIAGVQEPQI